MFNSNFLENYLYASIPLTKHMGLKVVEISKDKSVLSAPVINNINHKKTVFGGSLHSVTTLTCWSLLYANFVEYYNDKDKKNNKIPEIVVMKSEVNYLSPVTDDFFAESLVDDHTQLKLDKFFKIFEKKSKAKVELAAIIKQGKNKAVDYKGVFAVV